MFGVALAMSIAGLLIGPAITSWAHGRSEWLRVIDAAMLGVVLPALLLRIVPHLVEEIGAIAVAAVAAGYVAFSVLEARTHARAPRLGAAILLPTLAIHSFLDGSALAVAFQHGVTDAAGATLGAALVVHRIPEGLVIANALVPTLGVRGAWHRIAALATMTVAGALIGRELLAHAPDRALHLVVAVGVGVMIRMVVHAHHDERGGTRREWRDGLAFVGTAALSCVVPPPWQLLSRSQPHELSAAHAIVPLFLETAPWVLAALVLGHLAGRSRHTVRYPEAAIEDSCPLERSWPAGWSIAAILSTSWLGPWFAGAVMLLGAAAAWWSSGSRPTLEAFLPRASAVLPSYAAGVAVAVALEAAVPADALAQVAAIGWAAAPIAIAAACLVPMSAVGLVPIAAILVHKGLAPGLGLAFVLASVVFASRPRTSPPWRVPVGVVVATAIAMAIEPLLEARPFLHDVGNHRHAGFEYAAAVAISAWILWELVRRGPRPFLEAIR